MVLPLVVVLAAGGTIAGRSSRAGSAVEYQAGEIAGDALLASVPGLDRIARIRCRQIASIGSEDMTDDVWLALAREAVLESAREDVSGVVVLHGTDTLEETAVFLDLTVRSPGNSPAPLSKPLVLTGAMRPVDAVSADGAANILAAVSVAANPASAGRGVLVVMNDVVHRARFVTKRDTTALDAFESPCGGPEGRVTGGRIHYFRTASAGAFSSDACFDVRNMRELPRVYIIYGHAGQSRELADAAVAAGAWGIVHAGAGMGNIHKTVRAALAEAVRGGTIVVCASRAGNGIVPFTEAMRRDGFVSALDLNAQKARVVLQLALTRCSTPGGVRDVFSAYR